MLLTLLLASDSNQLIKICGIIAVVALIAWLVFHYYESIPVPYRTPFNIVISFLVVVILILFVVWISGGGLPNILN